MPFTWPRRMNQRRWFRERLPDSTGRSGAQEDRGKSRRRNCPAKSRRKCGNKTARSSIVTSGPFLSIADWKRRLERRGGVLDEVDEVRREPGARLRRTGRRIRVGARLIEARRVRVGGAVGLTR